jgi:streptogramin lyase
MSRFALPNYEAPGVDGWHRTRVVAAISLAVTLVVAGCSSTTPAAPSPAVATGSGASTASPSSVLASSAPSASALATGSATPDCPGAPGATAGSAQVPDPAAPAGTIVSTTPAAGEPVSAVVQDGSVWVGDHGDPTVYRINPTTAVATRIDVDPKHRFDHGGPLAAGLGGPWYGPFLAGTDVRGWVHVDAATSTPNTPATLQVALSKLGIRGATSVAETTDGVWGAASDVGSITVAEFDRQDGHELRRVAVPMSAAVAQAPRLLLSAFSSLWETADGDSLLERIDPSTGTLVGAVALPVSAVGMVAGDKAIYVATADASILRVDPATDCVTALRFLGGAATDPANGGDLIAATFAPGAVYAAYDRGGLAVLDPTTLAVRKAFRLDYQDFQGALTVTPDGTVWYPTFTNDTVLQVKP